MKAILMSSDFAKIPGSMEAAEKLTGKPRKEINIAVINEAAGVEFGDSRWAIDALKYAADNFGGGIEIVHLLAIDKSQIAERLSVADMIFVLGGNTEWLKVVLDKTGASELLPELLKTKVWVGNSAGSMILGHRPSCKTQDFIYGASEYFGIDRYFDWLDFLILPHINDADRNLDRIKAESTRHDCPVYALSDQSAIIVNGSEISMLGKNFYKLRQSMILESDILQT